MLRMPSILLFFLKKFLDGGFNVSSIIMDIKKKHCNRIARTVFLIPKANVQKQLML
jgi:hypothetical protein